MTQPWWKAVLNALLALLQAGKQAGLYSEKPGATKAEGKPHKPGSDLGLHR